MFKRKALEKLKYWKEKKAPKYSVLLEGARRVGKSTIAEELAKKIAKDRLIIKWADLEYRIVNDVFSKINTQFEVTKYRVSKKMHKADKKIKRITSSYKAEN